MKMKKNKKEKQRNWSTDKQLRIEYLEEENRELKEKLKQEMGARKRLYRTINLLEAEIEELEGLEGEEEE